MPYRNQEYNEDRPRKINQIKKFCFKYWGKMKRILFGVLGTIVIVSLIGGLVFGVQKCRKFEKKSAKEEAKTVLSNLEDFKKKATRDGKVDISFHCSQPRGCSGGGVRYGCYAFTETGDVWKVVCSVDKCRVDQGGE